jgi:hypothetical protein
MKNDLFFGLAIRGTNCYERSFCIRRDRARRRIMKRCGVILATIAILGGLGWMLHEAGSSAGADREAPSKTGQLKNADPMATPAGWRYRQSQPHHWRYIMLKK